MLNWTRFSLSRIACLPALLFLAFSATSIVPVVFTNEEIRIDFGGHFELREKPGTTQYPSQLPQPLTTVDFCPWRPQAPEVQQVMRPERGFLCELHILPGATEAKAMAQIQSAHSGNKKRHVRNFRLQATDIGGHRVIHWRFQAGKTRLDHYLLIGKKFNYLFVSSPYGSNGAIEEIIGRAAFH